MAALAPCKNAASSKMCEEHLSPLERLLQLGIPKNRANKALAATGHRGAQSALNWLDAHARDTHLDHEEPREYVLYACPTGELADELEKFWADGRQLGWNRVHDYLPHVTLVSFFKAHDESAEDIASALWATLDQERRPAIERLNLDFYASPNYMGLFIEEKQAEWLRSVAMRFANKLKAMRINADVETKSLHLTLAYQYSSHYYHRLRYLAEKVDSRSNADWEIRLYSRDPRFRDAHLHIILREHTPKACNELKLQAGDFVYVLKGTCISGGWAQGTSWQTGIKGCFPLRHTDQIAESDAWTLHASFPITKPHFHSNNRETWKMGKRTIFSGENAHTPDDLSSDGQSAETVEIPPSPREIFICRHGERVDFTFGTWTSNSFESDGRYIRRDLNMPKELPERKVQDYVNDSPLTSIGEVQANLLGEAMKLSRVKIDAAFASPSLRCIQTMSQILHGLRSNIQINVEPGLMEWLGWYRSGLPTWMSSDELLKAGFNVNESYDPIVNIGDLECHENVAKYYERSHTIVNRMIESTMGNILIVGHASSLAACTQRLVGGQVPCATDFSRSVQKIPYLACIKVHQEHDRWKIHPAPFPPITHSSNSALDWKILG